MSVPRRVDVVAALAFGLFGAVATNAAADAHRAGVGPVVESVEPAVMPPTALPRRRTLVIRGSGFTHGDVLEFLDGAGRRYVRRPDFVSSDGTWMRYDIAVGTRAARWTVRVIAPDGTLDTGYFGVDAGAVAAEMVLVYSTRIDGAGGPADRAFGDRARVARVAELRRRLAPPSDERVPVVYAVTLNGQSVSPGLLVLQQGPRYFLPVPLVEDMDLALSPGFEAVVYEGLDYADASELVGIEATLDPATQSLHLEADASAFNVTQLSGHRVDPGLPQPSATALFLNYNATAVGNDRENQVDTLLEAGLVRGQYVLRTSGVASDVGGDADWVRLETSLVNDRPRTRTRLILGDSVARPTDVSDPGLPYPFAGVQWGTNFENDPDYQPYPLPTLYGEAAGSSVLDLYIDQSLRLRSDVEAGPFVIDSPPLSDGSGDVRIVVRDVTGRESVYTAPYYVSTRLLQPGVADYEINAGAVRESFGSESWAYGEGFVAGRYRRGLSEGFTAQVLAEASRDHQVIGGAGVVLVPRLGVASVTAAVSQDDRGRGTSLGATFEHSAPRWRASVGARVLDDDFTQLGRTDTGRETARLYTAELGWSTRGGGAFSLRYADRERVNDSRSRLLSAGYSRQLPRGMHLTVSASIGERVELIHRDGADGFESVEDHRLGVSVRKYLGSRQSVGISQTRDVETRAGRRVENDRTTVSNQRYAPRDIGFGYELEYDYADGSRYSGGIDWNTRNGNFSARASHGDHGTNYFANVDGSIVVAGGSVFVERPLRDGFAVVTTGDFPGVNIYRNNQLAARSDRRGMAVVPALLPYQANELSIRENDLPLSARIEARSVTVVPYFKGAAPATFGLYRQRSALVVLVDEEGDTLPPGTRLAPDAGGEAYRVAMRGEVYIEDLHSDRAFTATRPDGRRCAVTVAAVTAADDEIPRIGPLTCTPLRPT